MSKYSFFLPTRKGSCRVTNKNTRKFSSYDGGLVQLKIQQLLDVEKVDNIVISTNDDDTIRVAQSFNSDKIQIIKRPEDLCLSSTNLEDLIKYVPTIIDSQHIIWVHATSPFVDASILNEAIELYEKKVLQEKEYDSLMSVSKIQEFLWSKEKNCPVNYSRDDKKWPRTQDIEPLYSINSGIFINSRDNYLANNDRIGKNPYLFELDKIHSIDVDWPEDFDIAESLFDKHFNPNKI